MEEFDLCEALRMAVSFVSLQAQYKGIELRVDIPDTPCVVRGDTHRLRQVFVNLLTNALKFTQAGEVSLRTRTEDDAVVVEVRDSGIGISGDFLPMVFEPFRRSDDARGYPGLGIGLAIARRLVEAHGGHISVTSDGRGRGAVFTVRLPLAN
jgi:signal transduction histidine kinase